MVKFLCFPVFAAIFFLPVPMMLLLIQKDSPTTTNESVSSTPTNLSVAEQKKSDIAVQGLKGKWKLCLNRLLPGEGSKKVLSKNVFKYDANGNMIELSNYKADGKVNSTIRSTYDASGKLIKEETILGNGTVDLVSAIKTDAKGNKIEQARCKANGQYCI